MANEEIANPKSEAWNVAGGFSTFKILMPLIEMDKLVKVAIYGVEDINDSIEINERVKVKLRIEALRRFITSLEILIENTEFACNKTQKQILSDLTIKIENVKRYMDGITRITMDSRTGKSVEIINERHFDICLSHLRNIKKQIPDPLNVNSLIFPQSKDTNIEEIKRRFIEGGAR